VIGWFRRPGLYVWISLVAFTLAFLGSSELGMGPDEPVHYIKAAATVRGDIFGERVSLRDVRANYPLANPRSSNPEEVVRAKFTAKSGVYNSRFFSLPEEVAVGTIFPCFAGQRDVPASCGSPIDVPVADPGGLFSYTGAYPPGPYMVYGLGSLVPGDRSTHWYGARLFGFLAAMTLVACAVALMLDATRHRAWRIAGLALATVPTSLFIFAVVNASAWELAGGLGVATGVVRLSRPRPPTVRTWVLLFAVGVALALSRPLGPVWLVPFALVLIVLIGWRPTLALARGSRVALVATGAVMASAISTVLWVRANDANLPIIWSRVDDALRLALSDLWLVVLQTPSITGWNETPIATPWYWFYGLGLVALFGVALVFAALRERLALVLTAVLSVGAAIFIAAFPFEMYRQRYAMQARYVLPFAVLIPLLAGELLARGAERAPRERTGDTPWYPTSALTTGVGGSRPPLRRGSRADSRYG
jgi:hypothetical protein